MKKYKKINELDVYLFMRGISIDPLSGGYGISAKTIAGFMKTSLYQVRKYLKSLENKGALEVRSYSDKCYCYEFCECEATGLVYKQWYFKNDVVEYEEQNKKQSKEIEELCMKCFVY